MCNYPRRKWPHQSKQHRMQHTCNSGLAGENELCISFLSFLLPPPSHRPPVRLVFFSSDGALYGRGTFSSLSCNRLGSWLLGLLWVWNQRYHFSFSAQLSSVFLPLIFSVWCFPGLTCYFPWSSPFCPCLPSYSSPFQMTSPKWLFYTHTHTPILICDPPGMGAGIWTWSFATFPHSSP